MSDAEYQEFERRILGRSRLAYGLRLLGMPTRDAIVAAAQLDDIAHLSAPMWHVSWPSEVRP